MGGQLWAGSGNPVVSVTTEPQVGVPRITTCSVPVKLTLWATSEVSCPLSPGWAQAREVRGRGKSLVSARPPPSRSPHPPTPPRPPCRTPGPIVNGYVPISKITALALSVSGHARSPCPFSSGKRSRFQVSAASPSSVVSSGPACTFVNTPLIAFSPVASFECKLYPLLGPDLR